MNQNSIVIIVQIDDEKKRTLGFIVDSVSDVVSITKENLREPPDFSGNVDIRYVEKIGQVGNKMVIIIDLHKFFTEKEVAILDNAAGAKGD